MFAINRIVNTTPIIVLIINCILTINSINGQVVTTPVTAPVTAAIPATTTNTGNNNNYTGCVDTTLIEQDRFIVRIGSPTIVCIQIANTEQSWAINGVQYVRLNFSPEADEYSKFHIPNSYRDLVINANRTNQFNGKNITISTSSLQALSLNRIYYDVSKGYIFPFLTAIISVTNGKVESNSISWDDACVFCGGLGTGRCLENTYNFNGIQQTSASAGQNTKSCYLSRKDCDEAYKLDKTTTICDITLYVVWSGTDSTGNAFQSQAYRFSAFPPQSISNRFTQLIPTFGLTADDFDITKYVGIDFTSDNTTAGTTVSNTTTPPGVTAPVPTTVTVPVPVPTTLTAQVNTTVRKHQRNLLQSYKDILIEQAEQYEIISKIINSSSSTSTTSSTTDKK